MLRNILSVGGLTLASRVLGFIRDVLTAAILGAGPVADAFFVAFRLPNNFRAIFAEGAFNAAFVPVFSDVLVNDGRDAAKSFAEKICAVLLSSQIVLLVIFLAIMPWFMLVFAPGFEADPVKFDLAVHFTRITFPYLLFIALVSLQGAMLNSVGRFGAAAAAPIVMNICLILALIGLTPLLPSAGHALAWGVLLSGVAQFLYLAWDCHRAGWALTLPWPRLTPRVIQFLRVLGPAALGAGVVQINLLVDTLIASLLPTGSVSYLYYADRLNQLPMGVIGIAVGTVLLPELSRALKSGAEARALDRQNRAIELSLVFTVPAAVAFAVAALPILRVLFEHGAFTLVAATESARTLTAYSFGLPAFVVIRSLIPGFHARQDTRTPVKIAMVAITINIALKLVLMGPLAQTGIAVGTSVSAWINIILLAWVLHRRGHFAMDARLRRAIPRLVVASLGMGGVLIGLQSALASALAAPSLALRFAALAVLLLAGLMAYGAFAAALGLVRRQDFAGLRRR
ncbi:MAG: murein biosynthesis integral membrane protein MurJ [Azospirillaceae bacterium]|nr:murein biosynthesis integral membrane protein MurJ [Azospirillaceae bacterium]